MCCDSLGCKESDMTEQLNHKFGGRTPQGHRMEGNSHDEPALLGRGCVSTPAHGTVATGASKNQAPDPALTLSSHQSRPPPGWRPGHALTLHAHVRALTLSSHQSRPPPGRRPGHALTLHAQVRGRCLCLALTDDLALAVVARWPKWPRCQGFLLGSTVNPKCANPHGVSVGADDDPEEPSALRAFTALIFRPKCNLEKTTEL